MFRFIDLGEASPDWDRVHQFAFFDLLDNRFVEFDGFQAWETWRDFESTLRSHAKCRPLDFPYRGNLTNDTVAMFRELCPDWVFVE